MPKIKPQKGPQYQFLNPASADIVIYGGAAGGGKTWALLMECLRHRNVPWIFCCDIPKEQYSGPQSRRSMGYKLRTFYSCERHS